jgi:NTP pyrophosphatase (non-canonical NTP hydrolase)
MTTSIALTNVLYERQKQDDKWGEQNHSMEKWLVILQEECGEAAQAALKDEEWRYRDEMVQVAAVALAAVECFDRQIEAISHS